MDDLVSKQSVNQAVKGLLEIIKVTKDTPNKPKKLLGDDDRMLHLLISIKKIPHKQSDKDAKISRIQLPFPIYAERSTVCLFAKDLEKSKKADDDVAKVHYKTLLESKDVVGISDVIPLHQLRTEFKTFEAKRHLCHSYDLFLTDSRITTYLPRLIGKEFWIKKRLPVKVNMLAKDLKKEFQKVLSSTYLYVTSKGSTCMLPVSISSAGRVASVRNVLTAIKCLPKIIPGGWPNIRGLYLKTKNSLGIPIYISPDSPNTVHLEKYMAKKPRVTSEELSTKLNTRVKVFEDGKVQLLKRKSTSDAEEDGTDEESDFYSILDKRQKGGKMQSRPKKIKTK